MNPVVWFEIAVSDMARARKFYEEVFQVELSELPMPGMEMYAFPGDPVNPGATGTLLKDDQSTPSMEGTKVYFHCEDVNTELSRVEGAGGQIILPKTSIGEHGWMAMFRDTEGNLIGLHAM